MEAVDPMFKVTVVRNPITKLLSGYRDKVQRYDLNGYYDRIYKHIFSVRSGKQDN